MINSRRGDTALVVLPEEAVVPDSKFLTPDEVAERYRGGISVGTLRNWRAMRLGPSFVKIGKAVLYPLDELDRSEEHTSELQSLMRISYAVFCLKKKKHKTKYKKTKNYIHKT